MNTIQNAYKGSRLIETMENYGNIHSFQTPHGMGFSINNLQL